MTEWKAQCSSNQVANTVQDAESLLKKHHELSDDISQIYAEVIAKFFNFIAFRVFKTLTFLTNNFVFLQNKRYF